MIGKMLLVLCVGSVTEVSKFWAKAELMTLITCKSFLYCISLFHPVADLKFVCLYFTSGSEAVRWPLAA